jgi:hypothetical protein
LVHEQKMFPNWIQEEEVNSATSICCMHRTSSGDRSNKCSFLHQQARYMKWWFPIRDLPNKLVKLIPEVFDQFKTEICHWTIFFYKCRNLGKTSSFVASHVQMVQTLREEEQLQQQHHLQQQVCPWFLVAGNFASSMIVSTVLLHQRVLAGSTMLSRDRSKSRQRWARDWIWRHPITDTHYKTPQTHLAFKEWRK